MTLPEQRPPQPHSPAHFRSMVRYLIAPVFVILSAWFVWGPDFTDIPETEIVAISQDEFATDPVRQVMLGTPSILAGGYQLNCMECHRLFQSTDHPPRQLTQHQEIKLKHGLNDRCLHCHDNENRDELMLTSDLTVPFIEAPRLCGKCHGPTYRDWQDGMHGRTNGYWDQSRGEQQRLSCTQCHDPHSPAFDPMRSLPGPNTLRMGDPSRAHQTEDDAKHNPLRRWSRRSTKAQGEHE